MTVAIGIAASGDEHIGILGQIATVLIDPQRAKQLREVQTADDVLRVLAADGTMAPPTVP